jgi:hypothetical protein
VCICVFIYNMCICIYIYLWHVHICIYIYVYVCIYIKEVSKRYPQITMVGLAWVGWFGVTSILRSIMEVWWGIRIILPSYKDETTYIVKIGIIFNIIHIIHFLIIYTNIHIYDIINIIIYIYIYYNIYI